ncbi:MAG TPA: glucose-6-phosphate dehydrogenase, partial [Sphingomonas sp.]
MTDAFARTPPAAVLPAQRLLLFGATGDLSQRMLLPSLFSLHAEKLIGPDLRIIGTARSELDDEGFRKAAAEALDKFLAPEARAPDAVPSFLDRLRYVPLDASKPESFSALAGAMGSDRDQHTAIYLSTAPSLFGSTIAGLQSAGLDGPNCRIGLEKPLGHDLASSAVINDAVAAAYAEGQTFRIDHYLGKETVQNLLALRFGNRMFEPLWNAENIEHVQITVSETVGLEGRVSYYDGVGALRDMVQNHMLQLLALVAMEPPARFGPRSVRDEKVKVLRSLRRIDRATVATETVRGQYTDGAVGGKAVPGYVDELGRSSNTETFVAVKAHVDHWRWQGVPFYLRTGMRLPNRHSEIV